MSEEWTEAALEKFGHGLTAWQRDVFRALCSGVDERLLAGRGRRAGHTTVLRRVEVAMKSAAGRNLYLWDGSDVPEDLRDDPTYPAFYKRPE